MLSFSKHTKHTTFPIRACTVQLILNSRRDRNEIFVFLRRSNIPFVQFGVNTVEVVQSFKQIRPKENSKRRNLPKIKTNNKRERTSFVRFSLKFAFLFISIVTSQPNQRLQIAEGEQIKDRKIDENCSKVDQKCV